MGTNIQKETLDFTEEDFTFLVNTNLESCFHLSQLAHPLLKASEAANIILISSIAGVVASNIVSVVYGATKGNTFLGMAGLTGSFIVVNFKFLIY